MAGVVVHGSAHTGADYPGTAVTAPVTSEMVGVDAVSTKPATPMFYTFKNIGDRGTARTLVPFFGFLITIMHQ